MSNGTQRANTAIDTCQQAYEEELAKRLQAEADLMRLSARIEHAQTLLANAETEAGFPVKGKIARVRKVLRGDRGR